MLVTRDLYVELYVFNKDGLVGPVSHCWEHFTDEILKIAISLANTYNGRKIIKVLF